MLAGLLGAQNRVPPTPRQFPIVHQVDLRVLAENVDRIAQTLQQLGAPLPLNVRYGVRGSSTPEEAQELLDRSVLVAVDIRPDRHVQVVRGPARPILDENGWRMFLVKVWNEAGTADE